MVETMVASVLLECRSISKTFGALRALNDFSCSIEDGEIVGLVGPNGAGKSTLANVITGQLRADSGRVIFSGEDITRRKPHEIARKGIMRTFQVQRPLIDGTAMENVLVSAMFAGNTSIANARGLTLDSCAELQLGDKLHSDVGTLNSQQRQILQLARALVAKPKLIILDEVLAGLSEYEWDKLVKLLHRIREESKITMLVVEHNMQAIVSLCDRLIVMSCGTKLIEGSPSEVLSDAQVASVYLGG